MSFLPLIFKPNLQNVIGLNTDPRTPKGYRNQGLSSSMTDLNDVFGGILISSGSDMIFSSTLSFVINLLQ